MKFTNGEQIYKVPQNIVILSLIYIGPGWFASLSSKFLSMPGGRLLVLAGTDRLDKELIIGQMQGKFKLVLLTESSHCIMEDQPEKFAHLLKEFWDRNQPLTFIKRFPINDIKK
jgi:protein phosphatase methylesterase 1